MKKEKLKATEKDGGDHKSKFSLIHNLSGILFPI